LGELTTITKQWTRGVMRVSNEHTRKNLTSPHPSRTRLPPSRPIKPEKLV